VISVFQDYLGYMWFYTQLGLARYDGYKMSVYMDGISGLSLYEDRDNVLWAGSWSRGLYRFEREKDRFINFSHNDKDSFSISSNVVHSMFEDTRGRFWVGTAKGLDLFDRKSNKFTHFNFLDRCYSKDIFNYLRDLSSSRKRLGAILKVGNNADIVKTLELKKRTTILIVMIGEAGYDFGWLTDSGGKKLFDYDYKITTHAGGALNNRMQLQLLTLDAGIYEMHYTSNYFYSYEDKFQHNNSLDYEIRTGEPPELTDLWGIQVIDVSEDEKKITELLNAHHSTLLNSKIFTIIEEEKTGKLYVGTNSPGLWEFDESQKVITNSNLSYKTNSKRGIGSVEAFYKSRDGQIWIATTVGLCKYDPLSNDLRFYQPTPTTKDIITNHINSLVEDNDGNIWGGSVYNGLLKFDRKTDSFIRYRNIPDDPLSISGDAVLSVCVDRTGILWVGTWGTGVNKWDIKKWKFQKYDENYLKSTLNNLMITSIYEDDFKNLWLGTFKGLYFYNSNSKEFKHFIHKSNDKNSLSSDSIYQIIGDSFDRTKIWLSTENGLNRFDPKTQSFSHFINIIGDPGTIDNNYSRYIFIDSKGVLWAGTLTGLNKFDRSTERFTLYSNYHQAPGLLGSSTIDYMLEDKNNNLWIGYNGPGLLHLDRQNNIFKSYMADLNSDYIMGILTICENKEGNLYLGTFMQGLYLFEKDKGKIINHFTKANGLVDNKILTMISDDNENLWFTNHSGLTRYNPSSGTFKHYTRSEGLVETNEIHWFPLYKRKNGQIFFCGTNGINVFYPESIEDDSIPPQVVIQKISLFNRPDEKFEYEGFISEIKEIILPHNHNDLHFEYAGLHYGEPQRNKYKYILEGFDKEWIDAGNSRTATYTNLDPGEYTFRVKACNRDGIWNEAGASLKVIINPPLWATTWAYLFYLILFGSILYYTWRMQLKRVRVKHEFEMSKFEAQKLHEVDEMKSRFFANISHEFRTPLTLILGPVKQIIERTKETRTKEDLNLVHRNANRLLGLVNQLLDISKIESGNMKLQTTPINVIPYLKALVLSFTSYAERKRISLNFVSDVNEIIVYIDKDKFEKIINNILSNAFKFTPDDGSIKVIVNQDNKNLRIAVSDTGVGIPKEKLQKIFDRFYQVDGSHTREQEGTGIGLSLTKELVELHKGNIEVESEEGKGSSFIISIPLGTNHLKPDEIVELESEQIEHPIAESILADTPVKKTKPSEMDFITQADKPVLLIVEDNYDVRNYIRNNLNNAYRIIEAVDGEDGWNKSTNNIPDLIVSDVMMPKMDGFELCKRIKTDERTSHIPVILLTAKAAKQDKLDGYEIGADDYIMKPFEPDELNARIKNLITQRKKLQEHFKKNGVVDFGQSHITSVDKKFLQKVLDRITQHLSDSSFSVEMLAEDLGISRSVVHRKILSLTGETPGDLIRRIRLNKAAELIQKKFGNLSEIALEVGITNPAHFSENFKKQFGVSPSHYQ
jgi:signal transduction histidine kinase/DNA-binding response OmpR family regulator/ligand-binding sensor domain-containing protein